MSVATTAAPPTTPAKEPLCIVLPGDDVTDQIRHASAATATSTKNKPPKLGTGLRSYDDVVGGGGTSSSDSGVVKVVVATVAGRLVHQRSNNTYYVKQNVVRYRPRSEDRVIGIVEERVAGDGNGGDVYRVNIGSSHPAQLSNLSFEGATKRNRPNLPAGTLLYCRIQSTPPAMDPVLSCQLGPHDSGIPRRDWMTNEGTYGELKGGTCRKIPLGLARELLYPNNLVLGELGRSKIPFEVCVGVNGLLWIHSSRPEYTIMIQNAVFNSQVLTPPQVRGMVKSLVENVNGQIEEDGDEE
jgi:exosome complex component RRP40